MIIYLDFDGVLHPASVVVGKDSAGKRVPEMRGPGSLMMWAPVLEKALADLPQVQIVISSRWVWWFGIEFCRAALPPPLAAKVVGATWEGSENMPVGWIHLPRCEQILLHVRRHGIEDWIAIDDDDQGLNPEDVDRWRYIICPPELGIRDPHASHAFKMALHRVAPQKRSTTVRLARFETAQESVGMMIAMCSKLIAQERAKAVPDLNRIEALRERQGRYADEQNNLDFDDDNAIEWVYSYYCPLVRAGMLDGEEGSPW